MRTPPLLCALLVACGASAVAAQAAGQPALRPAPALPPPEAPPKAQPPRGPPAAAGSTLEFHGNVLFNEYVYRSLLQLPADAPPTRETAQLVAKKIARFLHDAGYVLATVRAKAVGGRVHVDVEEGQLDKVIIVGEGAFETLRLKLELSMPANVFNRPQLEAQLKRIAARYQLQDFAYELVPVDDPQTAQPQLDDLEPLQALPFVKPGRPYELRIFVQPSAWGTGLSPDLYIGGVDGLGIGAHYSGKDLLLPGDRYVVRGRIAGTLRSHLDTAASRPVLSRTRAEARWFSPPLIGDGFRPTFGGAVDLVSQQRGDLTLDNFNEATLEMSLGVAATVARELTLGFGAGVERRFLFDLEPVGAPTGQVADAPKAQTRGYLQGVVRVTANPDEIRRDRRHAIDVDARYYGPSSASRSPTVRLGVGYQKMWSVGWHELWLTARGTLLSGDVTFADEQSIGEHLRGPFGATEFGRTLGSVGMEYRYSLLRDLFKVGIYHDAVAWGWLDRTMVEPKQSARAGNAFGLGLHALVIDEFQIDAYFGLGWLTDGRSAQGLAVAIRQAF